jgi:hypothetical protein
MILTASMTKIAGNPLKRNSNYFIINKLNYLVMSELKNQKQNCSMHISFCTQKGGAGKSVFTTLAASWLHYELGFNPTCQHQHRKCHIIKYIQARIFHYGGLHLFLFIFKNLQI